jgi:hypothetical protein
MYRHQQQPSNREEFVQIAVHVRVACSALVYVGVRVAIFTVCFPYGMDQKRARKGLAQPQAWHAGGSALPEQGETCELAGVTCEWHVRPLGACIRI